MMSCDNVCNSACESLHVLHVIITGISFIFP